MYIIIYIIIHIIYICIYSKHETSSSDMNANNALRYF